LAAQKSQLESRISELKNDKTQAIAQKEAMDQQNAIIEAEIKNTEEQITVYTALVEQETVKWLRPGQKKRSSMICSFVESA
jgi:hypothetical protein